MVSQRGVAYAIASKMCATVARTCAIAVKIVATGAKTY
jgi:hypothetical protein